MSLIAKAPRDQFPTTNDATLASLPGIFLPSGRRHTSHQLRNEKENTMRIAYLTTDDVNRDLAIRMAEDCGATLYLLWPHDPPPDGRFDAVLYDWDYWPRDRRQEILQELLTAPTHGLVALHGYHLEEEHIDGLRRNGVFTFHRLEPEIFEFLGRKADEGPGVLFGGDSGADGSTPLCDRRGEGRVRGGSALGGVADRDRSQAFDQIIGRAPTPDFIAQAAEECRRRMERLGDDRLRSIAGWKMEGYTNGEIAAKLGCARVAVERRLRLIRRLWEEGDSHE
jgi:hypothetical protein